MTTKIIITFMFLNSFVSFATIKNENKEMNTIAVADFFVTTPQELLTALSGATAGSNIYISDSNGGTYTFSTKISITKNGTNGNLISLSPNPSNTTRIKFDFSSMAENSGNRAISVSGSYWHIKGIDVFGAGDNGMFISGNNNLVEFCSFSECKDSGLQIGSGASNNTILNCDSYYNADSSEENADGFACKLDAGTGNKFVGCRAWQNLDDGWDGYLRGADNITTTYENCWAIKNGYLKSGLVGNGDGNGFKTGGSDDKLLKHNAIYKNCMAVGNVFDGFDHNSNRGNVELYNCGAYSNGKNISFSTSNIADFLKIKNTVSVSSVSSDGFSATTTDITNNSWQNGLVANAADYVSLDINLLIAPRKADGSLPDVDFMKLVSGSDLIDKGINVGLPFNGPAPDLGPFESGTLGLQDIKVVESFNNFPNPFSSETTIVFNLKQASKIQISIYNLVGLEVGAIPEKMYPTGKNSIILDRNKLSSGHYLLVVKGINNQRNSKIISIQ
ncbi:right-handed parallel beta-helix repeat-containing protein [Mariniflexile fucanivorans]|nr:T9SS type A sorting domain-containing protein [Mariniflexile fucanivorans]